MHLFFLEQGMHANDDCDIGSYFTFLQFFVNRFLQMR